MPDPRYDARAQDAGLIPRQRLAFLARQIHRLGERPLLELLFELQAGAPFNETLEAYAALEVYADFIAAHGGRELEPVPARAN